MIFRVWLDSVAGNYEQYSGYVDVIADDRSDAAQKAFDKLRRTSFPDRNSTMWRVLRIEESSNQLHSRG